MRTRVQLGLILILILALPALATTEDLGWSNNLNLQASQDPANYRLCLAERFKLNDQQLDLVLNNVAKPADAYVLLRMGELSHQTPEHLVRQYKADQSKGWGVLAQHLGIKPGSAEFHALKRGHDLPGYKHEVKQLKAKSAKTRHIKEPKHVKAVKPARSEDRLYHSQSSHAASHESKHPEHAERPTNDDQSETHHR